MNFVPESAEFPFRALGEGQPPDWQGISLALNPVCKLLHIPCDLHCIPNTKGRIRSSHRQTRTPERERCAQTHGINTAVGQ